MKKDSANHPDVLFRGYLRVGLAVTLVELAALYFLKENLNYRLLPAVVLAFLLASNLGFVLNRVWTFRSNQSTLIRQYTKFLFTSSVGLTVTVLLMWLLAIKWRLFSGWTAHDYLICKLLTSCVIVVWNFLSNKLWTFADAVRLHPDLSRKIEYNHFLSVVVPAYNEEKRILPTVEAIVNYLLQRQIDGEVIIVDDGSDDRTLEVCENRFRKVAFVSTIRTPRNRGKGHAVKFGIQHATGEYVLLADADNSTPVEEFEKFRPHLERDRILIGSRYVHPGLVERAQPWYRIALSRLANRLIRLFVVEGVFDTQCGFKVMPVEFARWFSRLQRVERFAFDIELLSLAQLAGLEILEIPVRWFNSPHSRLRPIRDTLWTFVDLVRIKLFIWRGTYAQARRHTAEAHLSPTVRNPG